MNLVERKRTVEFPIEIHPLREAELPTIERELGLDVAAPGKHRDRFARQQERSVVYLVAWLNDRPVGHGLVKWQGADNPELHSIHDCPDIEDLFVNPTVRSRGIGSRLLEAAENLARERGYAKIGLAVGVENPRAHALYESRGYRDAGAGVYTERWSLVDANGETHHYAETCVYLIKPLRDDNYSR